MYEQICNLVNVLLRKLLKSNAQYITSSLTHQGKVIFSSRVPLVNRQVGQCRLHADDCQVSPGFRIYKANLENMSRVMRKPTFCICENKDADQLRGNHEADQRLCFRYINSIIPLLSKSEISSL